MAQQVLLTRDSIQTMLNNPNPKYVIVDVNGNQQQIFDENNRAIPCK